DIPEDGQLAANIAHFARALRRAGLRIGPGRIVEAARAVAAVGFTRRDDFYWVLHASFVSRPEERAVFAQVFRLYWRDPQFLEHMMSLWLPALHGTQDERAADAAERRAAEALLDGAGAAPPPPATEEATEVRMEASQSYSAAERLRTLDFELMSVDEVAEA